MSQQFEAKRYTNSSKYPIPFDRLHPGSLFMISQEKSRGMKYSRDKRIYRKAQSHEGFFAVNISNEEPAVLYPQDLVQPVREEK